MTMRVDFCPHCEPTTAGHALGCPYEPYFPPVEREDMETVNHTTLHINWYNGATHKSGCIEEDVFYKDHPNYERMPPVTKAPETKAEHRAWWKWYREQEN